MFSQCVKTRTRVTSLSGPNAVCTHLSANRITLTESKDTFVYQSLLILTRTLDSYFIWCVWLHSKYCTFARFGSLLMVDTTAGNLLYEFTVFTCHFSSRWTTTVQYLADTSLLCFPHPGWGPVSAVTALSCVHLLGVQWFFCNLSPIQESSKEDQPDHTRWDGLHHHHRTSARSAVIYICTLCPKTRGNSAPHSGFAEFWDAINQTKRDRSGLIRKGLERVTEEKKILAS